MNAGADSLGHLLVVDDDREIRELLKRFLSKQGFRVTTAADGTLMREVLAAWNIDLVILDFMLPGEDGLSICRDLRSRSQIPIVMLTVVAEESNRISGLEGGADDYIAKPFNPHELLARIKAVLRRTRSVPPANRGRHGDTIVFDGWHLDMGARRLTSPSNALVDLSGSEFDLLVAFALHPQQVLSRDQLLDIAYGKSENPFDRSIDMQVSRLRQKIEPDPKNPTVIQTVRGGGYMFMVDVGWHEKPAA